MKKTLLYGQSGGVTSVINTTAFGVLDEALKSKAFDRILVMKNGISGFMEEKFLDLTNSDPKKLEILKELPGTFFGSCRRNLKTDEEFKELFKIFEKYNVRYFLYNGGNDSMTMAMKIHEKAKELGYEISVIGLPKTVDNDLVETDHCPGYGSSAKYLYISVIEGTLDVKSMSKDSTKVFVIETMGRHSGWLAASTVIARRYMPTPHIILVPEIPLDEEKFLGRVESVLSKKGFCTIVVSEGIIDKNGNLISKIELKDTFGNVQLGGTGLKISKMISENLNVRVHTAIPDYLQRSGRHIASLQDLIEAEAVGRKGVQLLLKDINGVMVTIERESDEPYIWKLGYTELSKVAGKTRKLPKKYILDMDISEEFIKYVEPLTVGNSIPFYAEQRYNFSIF